VNFDRFPYSELQSILNLFIELGWSKRYETDKKTYEALLTDFKTIGHDIAHIITSMVNDIPGMKRFLLVHSVFNSDVTKQDWLERFMIELLQPDSSDQEWFLSEPEVPKELLKKFALFNPEPYKEIVDNIKITYKIWGQYTLGDQTEPIQIIDTDWERIEREANQSLENIKNHEIISTSSVSRYPELSVDELPF
jgi:hypothetical protein